MNAGCVNYNLICDAYPSKKCTGSYASGKPGDENIEVMLSTCPNPY